MTLRRTAAALLALGVVLALAGACTATPAPPPPRPAPAPPAVPGPGPIGGTAGPGTTLAGCPVFPADHAWNRNIASAPVRPDSAGVVAHVLAHGGANLHADFGGGGQYGIPFTVVAGGPLIPVNYTAYGDESDPGPFPVPLTAPVEGGAASDGDRHVLTLDSSTCRLYELYDAHPGAGSWSAASGAVWNLRSNALRPAGWTSADAAGLAILPGLARYDEVASGAITHALRFTVRRTRDATVLPATHAAATCTDDCAHAPAMGMRFRLKAGFDRSRYTGQARVILDALATYGMIVADNGSNWFISGDGDPRWNDDDLNQLKSVPGSAFEVVDTGAVNPG